MTPLLRDRAGTAALANRATHFALPTRLAAEIPIARHDFLDMAAVLEKHMDGRQFLVGDNVTVADLVAAYTLDMVRRDATNVQAAIGAEALVARCAFSAGESPAPVSVGAPG